MIARARAEQQEVKMSEKVRDFYAKEIDFDNGPVKCVLKSDYDALHAEAEALRVALLGIASANPSERGIEWAKSYASDGLKGSGSELYARWLDTFKDAEALRANIVRLTSNPADHRYWEGRYRDAEAELEAARGLLLEAKRLRIEALLSSAEPVKCGGVHGGLVCPGCEPAKGGDGEEG